MTPSEAVQLLVNRFPSLLHKFGSEELFQLAPPYHAYECFADEIKARISDDVCLTAACAFINELAESNDHLLNEAIHVATLENIGSDPDAAIKVKRCLRETALQKIVAIEHDLYGR